MESIFSIHMSRFTVVKSSHCGIALTLLSILPSRDLSKALEGCVEDKPMAFVRNMFSYKIVYYGALQMYHEAS